MYSSFTTPWILAHQAPLSMGFSRQEYRNGLPLLPPGGSSWSRIELASPGLLALQVDSLSRKCTGHNKHPLPTTQEKTLYMDITRWSTPKSDWLYSLFWHRRTHKTNFKLSEIIWPCLSLTAQCHSPLGALSYCHGQSARFVSRTGCIGDVWGAGIAKKIQVKYSCFWMES